MSPSVVAESRRNREAEWVVPQVGTPPRLKIVVPDPLSQPNIASAQPPNERLFDSSDLLMRTSHHTYLSLVTNEGFLLLVLLHIPVQGIPCAGSHNIDLPR